MICRGNSWLLIQKHLGEGMETEQFSVLFALSIVLGKASPWANNIYSICVYCLIESKKFENTLFENVQCREMSVIKQVKSSLIPLQCLCLDIQFVDKYVVHGKFYPTPNLSTNDILGSRIISTKTLKVRSVTHKLKRHSLLACFNLLLG